MATLKAFHGKWILHLKDFLRRYKRNRAGVLGLAIICYFSFIAIFAPWISPYDPLRLGEDTFGQPSAQHWMGTDNLGRDVLSGFIYGAGASLTVGLLAAFTSTGIGALIGSVSGYYGGLVDDVLMRIAELFQVIPQLFLALLMVAVFGSSIANVILVIGILGWPPIARIARAQFLSLKEREYVEASRALGESDLAVIFREILPNASPSIIVSSSMLVARAILLEASLSFLGLSDPSAASWGRMLSASQKFLGVGWWMSVFPGLAIFLAVLGMNLIGDALNDALNPRLREL